MGLDMYLRAKTTKRNYEGATGCCGGMFGIAPEDNGMVEIGYWRKAYDQQEIICRNISCYNGYDDNCVDFRVLPNEVDKILFDARKILDTHVFDEDGEDESTDYPTWRSKYKWEDTIKFFTEAKEILKDDPDAEIYYCQWY